MSLLLTLKNHVPAIQNLIPTSLIIKYAPKPGSLVSRVGSVGTAAIVGELYGLGVRHFSQSPTVIPHHYAIWFALAYQIQEWIHVSKVFAVKWVESPPAEPAHGYTERFRKICRQGLDKFDKIDLAISEALNIRSRKAINSENISQAQYLEMCRARAWKVFKRTFAEILSFTLSYYAVSQAGFGLYTNYSVSLFVVGKYALIDTIVVPALHQLIQQEPGKELPRVYKWISKIIPEL